MLLFRVSTLRRSSMSHILDGWLTGLVLVGGFFLAGLLEPLLSSWFSLLTGSSGIVLDSMGMEGMAGMAGMVGTGLVSGTKTTGSGAVGTEIGSGTSFLMGSNSMVSFASESVKQKGCVSKISIFAFSVRICGSSLFCTF